MSAMRIVHQKCYTNFYFHSRLWYCDIKLTKKYLNNTNKAYEVTEAETVGR